LYQSIRLEWYRAVRRPGLYMAFGLILAVMAWMAVLYSPHWPPDTNVPAFFSNAYNATLAGLGMSFQSLFVLLLPMAAVLPAGDSLALDRESGVDVGLIVRMGWRTYLWGKLAGNMAVSGLTTLSALVCASIAMTFVYPIGLPRDLGARRLAMTAHGVSALGYQPQFLPHLYWAHPALYVALAAGLATLATMALAGLVTGLSLWIPRRYLVLLIPVAAFFAGNYVAEFFGLWSWQPSVMAGSYLYDYHHGLSAVAGYWLTPIALLALLFWWRSRIREWPTTSTF